MSAQARASVWRAVAERGRAERNFEDFRGHLAALWDHPVEHLEAGTLDVWRRARLEAVAAHASWLAGFPMDPDDDLEMRLLLGQLLDIDETLTTLRRVLVQRMAATDP